MQPDLSPFPVLTGLKHGQYFRYRKSQQSVQSWKSGKFNISAFYGDFFCDSLLFLLLVSPFLNIEMQTGHICCFGLFPFILVGSWC